VSELFTRLQERARELGFGWFGVAPAEPLQQELKDLVRWLEEGRHGEMEWLARDPERRTDPARVLDGCRTVLMLGMNYLREQLPPPAEALSPPPQGFGRVSKYARTRDYHRVIEKAEVKLARFIDRELVPGARTKLYVDYGPLMERPWAARAGFGFLGKHTLLIHPQEGSFHFLAALVTTAVIEAPPPAIPDRTAGCGDCRRCIDACPTGAITGPWEFDARRCVSYLTIEKSGPVPEEFWPLQSGYLFGCDICQDVCPYNQSRAKPVQGSPLGEELVPERLSLVRLLEEADEFLAELEGKSSPLKRAGAESLRRNAVIVASENGGPAERAALERLVLREDQPDWLREMAQKALGKLGESARG
jgi:epoxyqueuosine reductase